EAVFDAQSTLEACLPVFTGMIREMKPLPDVMKKAAQNGFINATDLADYLVRKGLPFRSAYRVSGEIVSYCIGSGNVLETLSLDQYRLFSPLFEADVFDAISLENCVERRNSLGGTSVSSVEKQIAYVREKLSD
ncbi:MAG: argininosuccinate lyase, partial [Clostridia bacterium]|nr:argininosuccinate lyase [Clostridia bacterium]